MIVQVVSLLIHGKFQCRGCCATPSLKSPIHLKDFRNDLSVFGNVCNKSLIPVSAIEVEGKSMHWINYLQFPFPSIYNKTFIFVFNKREFIVVSLI